MSQKKSLHDESWAGFFHKSMRGARYAPTNQGARSLAGDAKQVLVPGGGGTGGNNASRRKGAYVRLTHAAPPLRSVSRRTATHP
jgi:hypothetical protein